MSSTQRPHLRAQAIVYRLAEAALLLDAATHAWIQQLLTLAHPVLQEWVTAQHAAQQEAPTRQVPTAALVTLLNENIVPHQQEPCVHFTSVKHDGGSAMFISGGYQPRDDRLTIVMSSSLITVSLYEVHFAETALYQLKDVVRHELTHRAQFRLRAQHTSSTLPFFGKNAFVGARQERRAAQEHDTLFHLPPRNYRQEFRPAKTLARHTDFALPRALFARDQVHHRHDLDRRVGSDEPRRQSGTEDYYGHPEEIMAYAAAAAYLLIDAHNPAHSPEVQHHATTLAVEQVLKAREHMGGVSTPAFRRWLKLFYQYLRPHLSHADIHAFMQQIHYQ